MSAKKQFIKLGLVLFAALLLVTVIGGSQSDPEPLPQATDDTSTEDAEAEDSPEVPEKTIRAFTAEEFKQAYDNLSLPNITPIIVAPSITGNMAADDAIRNIAEARGYQLRHVASGLLNQLDDKPVQELLISDWLSMKQMAAEEGVTLEFRSGYRSIEDQTELFVDRLLAAGGSVEAIAAGGQASVVDSVLALTAPPGYSRHHSGYTIDLVDPGFAVFEGSTAYNWISENNFERAKLHGFIPSYPDGIVNQGPNPEPWEFVWVSKEVTYE